jgi:opacity protein-like surface antigen
MSGSRGYFGAGSSQYEFEVFDFSGVAGFQSTWGLAVGTSTQITTNILGSLAGTYPNVGEGNAFKTAARVQTVTP